MEPSNKAGAWMEGQTTFVSPDIDDAKQALTTAADVAAFIQRKADDYAREFGSDDMGSLSFGNDAMREYHWGLLELVDEIRSLAATPHATESHALGGGDDA